LRTIGALLRRVKQPINFSFFVLLIPIKRLRYGVDMVLSLPCEELGFFPITHSSVGREGPGMALKLGIKVGTSNLTGKWECLGAQGDHDLLVFLVECNGPSEQPRSLVVLASVYVATTLLSAKNERRGVGSKVSQRVVYFKADYDQNPL
jgi:hypothetical protein